MTRPDSGSPDRRGGLGWGWILQVAAMVVLAGTWIAGVGWAVWSLRLSGMFTEVPDLLAAALVLVPIPLTFLAFRFRCTTPRDARCPDWLWYLGNVAGFLPALALCLAPVVVAGIRFLASR